MATATHHFSAAINLLYGNASFEPHKSLYDGRRGHVVNLMRYLTLGSALAALSTGLVKAATGAQLPNAATVTYTTATDGVAPLNDAARPAVNAAYHPAGNISGAAGLVSVYPITTPRNVSLNVTHGSSIVAMTHLVTGYDYYGQMQTELLTVTATGTSKTVAGKKTWAAILSMSFTSASNAQANTANLGWGSVFGLPYRITDASQLVPFGNGAIDITGTVTAADDTAVSNVTGDVRGTYAPSSAPDGTKKYAFWLTPADASSVQGLFGNTPV